MTKRPQAASQAAEDDCVPEWTWKYARAAMREGWGLDESCQIVRDDDTQIFPSDQAAAEHVKSRAAKGSEMHAVALALASREQLEDVPSWTADQAEEIDRERRV
jgi:hypothetical protein